MNEVHPRQPSLAARSKSIIRRGLAVLYRAIFTIAFCVFVAILFAIIIGSVILGEHDPRSNTTGVPRQWAPIESSTDIGPIHDVMESYALSDDVPGAIKLIKTTVVESDKIVAIVDLMHQVRFHQPDLVGQSYDSKRDNKSKAKKPIAMMTTDEIINEQQANDEKMKEYQAVKNKETVVRLEPIKEYLDTFDPSEERVKAYAAFATTYLLLGDKPKAANTYNQLAFDLSTVQSNRWPQWLRQIGEWFRPLLHERIGLTICGIMAALAFLFRPTAQISSRALAYWWYSKSTSPYIKRALAEGQQKLAVSKEDTP